MASPLAKLQAILLTSGLQISNPALYQVINQLITFLQKDQNSNAVVTAGSSSDVTALKNRTYWTELSEIANLPSSRQVIAGAGITLNYSTPNEVEISASEIPTTGVYVPAHLTNNGNINTFTFHDALWTRVKDHVIVHGWLEISASAPGTASITFSLPVASDLGSTEDLAGQANSGPEGGLVFGNVANDGATMLWSALALTTNPWYFTFQYEIIP